VHRSCGVSLLLTLVGHCVSKCHQYPPAFDHCNDVTWKKMWPSCLSVSHDACMQHTYIVISCNKELALRTKNKRKKIANIASAYNASLQLSQFSRGSLVPCFEVRDHPAGLVLICIFYACRRLPWADVRGYWVETPIRPVL